MIIKTLRDAILGLRGRLEAANSVTLESPPSVVNRRLYRRPPSDTPLDVVPNTRNKIRELGIVVSNFSRQVATEAQAKDEYIGNVQNQLAEIRKLTFWDNLGILTRRLIDFRAYKGIKVWEELKDSNSKLYVLNEREPDFLLEFFESKYPDTHIVYLTDKVDDRKPIPEQSPLHKYLNNFRDRDIIERCNHELRSAFLKALDFLKVSSIAPLCYPGVVIPGFVIADTEGAIMSSGGFLGIEVDYKRVEDLIPVMEKGSDEEVSRHIKFLESDFVLALTHILQNTPKKNSASGTNAVNNNKIAPYIAKFLYDASNDYDLDPVYGLSFDFVQNEGTQEVIAAMKALYSELKGDEKVQALFGVPQNFRPTTLMDTIKRLKSSEEGSKALESLMQKILDSFSSDLFEAASKVPDPEVKTVNNIPHEDGAIEIISDGFLTSNAVVTFSITGDDKKISRNIRLNESVAAALSNPGNENHNSATKVLDFAVSLAKKAPINVLKSDSSKIDIFEYAAKRVQGKLESELEISLKPNNTLLGLKKKVDIMIKENRFMDVFDLAKSIGMLTNIDETLICWDYRSESPIQRTYVI